MRKVFDHQAEPPLTCASWVPDHIRRNTPSLAEYQKRIERQRQEEDDLGVTPWEQILIFGGSLAATGLAIVSFTIASVDKTYHLGIGHKLENIRPNPHEDGLKHDVEDILHKLGHRIVQDEK